MHLLPGTNVLLQCAFYRISDSQNLHFIGILRLHFCILYPRGGVSPSLGGFNEKRKPSVIQITSFSVRMVRLELTQANAHYPLKVACLPFHHIRR